MSSALQLGLFSPRWANTEVDKRASTSGSPWFDPFLAHHRDTLNAAGPERLTFDEASWDHGARSAVGVDVECFRNLFLVCATRFADGKRITFEQSERSRLDREGLANLLRNNLIVTFNGNQYDLPLIYMALAGAKNEDLKRASDYIIKGGGRLETRVPRGLNHVDLVEPNPSVRQGLKMLHARLHGRFLVDLPYDPDAWLTPEQMNVTTLYCFNDIEATGLLREALRGPLELRVAMGREHKLDLRSKSDAQVGEAIVKKYVETALGRRLPKQGIAGEFFHYRIPEFISFTDPKLQRLVRDLSEIEFHVDAAGKVATPTTLAGLKITIGKGIYTFGIGGLHSTEAHRAVLTDDDYMVVDVDVASQYPNIIRRLGLYPGAMGPKFLEVYGALIDERLAAKAAGNKVKADGGRVAVNGVYGKLGSPYTPLYAPELMIATTLTGQLSILMLIERLEAVDISVVSANTDGVVSRVLYSRKNEFDTIIRDWEQATGLVTEETQYRALYNSSVNTYIAIREDGKIKRKGAIADPWREGDLRGQLSKNPNMTICSEAIVRYLVDDIPIERTIKNCQDPRSFITVIKVTGGAVWRGSPIGKVIRYFWSLDGDQIYYADGSRKVSKTNGAKPLSEMIDTLPNDIDYLRYCEEAVRLAIDLGVAL